MDDGHDGGTDKYEQLINEYKEALEDQKRAREYDKQRFEEVERLFHAALADQDRSQHLIEELQGKASLRQKLLSIVMLAFAIASAITVYGVLDPQFLSRIFDSNDVLIGVVASALFAVMTILLAKPKSKGENSFIEIDRELQRQKEFVRERMASIDSGHAQQDDPENAQFVRLPPPESELHTDFEAYINRAVEQLGLHMTVADRKASTLLDKGTIYLRRGLYFYIGCIVFWQLWGHFISFDGLVIAGMVSTSIAFVVIEFLAAWFLKQYRSFVDSSVSYMRVQSYYNRYLLSYYAIREFSEDGDSQSSRQEMLRLLAEEIKWPELKDVNSNDFNYMLESMGTLHTAFEKMRGMFVGKSESRIQ